MIEKLEAEAVSQMVNEEQGKVRNRITFDHDGVTLEVRARRRRDGSAVLGYSFDGVRLEKCVLLMLICPQGTCERSQSVKRQWAARNPPALVLQRRPHTALKSMDGPLEACLFEEAIVQCAGGLCVGRPASFAVEMACPMGAHRPFEMRINGWDLFRNGQYLAGGLINSDFKGTKIPKFLSIEAAALWMEEKRN